MLNYFLHACLFVRVIIMSPLFHINLAGDITSGDENHLCGASLRKSHKISHRHTCACAHWVGKLTPIAQARPEKLP